jgi:pyrimidine deaminase RibD-like protein
MAEYGVFEDGTCVADGFHGAAGKAAAEFHAVDLATAYPEMDGAYEVLEICPDHDEQPRRACEDCASDA